MKQSDVQTITKEEVEVQPSKLITHILKCQQP